MDLTPLTGCLVRRIAFDYEVTLTLASQDRDGLFADRVDAQLSIGGPFHIFREGRFHHVDPDHQGNYAALMPLLHATVESVSVDRAGTLRVWLSGDHKLHVPQHRHYEAWDVTGRGVQPLTRPGRRRR